MNPEPANVHLGTMSLLMEAVPHHESMASFRKTWAELGNPTAYETDDGIMAVDVTYAVEIDGIAHDHSPAAEHELVWGCDFCGAYSKSLAVVTAHEAVCDLNPDKQGD